MSTPYELVGRTRQKERTRNAVVAAARALVEQGVTPTVEEAAEQASVSRTTAYRYFPNQPALLAAAFPALEATSLLPDDAPDDVEARLDLVVDAFTRMIVDTEPQQRTMLRLSLGPQNPGPLLLRKGRAIAWIEEALAPLRPQMAGREVRRLTLAIRSATGIEALVWLTDVGGLSSEDARDLMRSSARAILRTALADGGRTTTRRS